MLALHRKYLSCCNMRHTMRSQWFRADSTRQRKLINHRCIQIHHRVMQTCRHQPMDIGSVLADDKAFVARGRGLLGKNYSTMLQPIKAQDSCTIKQITAKLLKVRMLRLRNYSSTCRLYLFWLLPNKKDPMEA